MHKITSNSIYFLLRSSTSGMPRKQRTGGECYARAYTRGRVSVHRTGSRNKVLTAARIFWTCEIAFLFLRTFSCGPSTHSIALDISCKIEDYADGPSIEIPPAVDWMSKGRSTSWTKAKGLVLVYFCRNEWTNLLSTRLAVNSFLLKWMLSLPVLQLLLADDLGQVSRSKGF